MVKINSESCYEEYFPEVKGKPLFWDANKKRGFCVVGETDKSYKVHIHFIFPGKLHFTKTSFFRWVVLGTVVVQ